MQDDDQTLLKKEYGKIEGNVKFSALERLLPATSIPNYIVAYWTEIPIYVKLSIFYMVVAFGWVIYKEIIPRIFQPTPLDTLSLSDFSASGTDTIVKPIETKTISETLSERPNIITTLVIDAVTIHNVDFHIQIENTGKVAAKSVKVMFKTNEFTSVEGDTYISRTLPSGNKLSLTTAPGVIQPNKITALVVTIFYKAEISGIEKGFSQQVRFFIRPADIKLQTIYPNSSEEKEGDEDIEEINMKANSDQFNQPEGSLYFILREFNEDGEPVVISFWNENKTFIFDAINLIVALKMKTQSGRLISLELPLLKTKDGSHRISVRWHYLKGAALSLDGINKEDLEETQ